jgi:mannonate dehydratase
MLRIADIVEPVPSPLWNLLRQVGVRDVVSLLTHGEVGFRNWLSVDSQDIEGFAVTPVRQDDGFYSWEKASLQRLKDAYEAVGLRVEVIEDNPPMDRIRLGLPGRDEEIEWFCDQIRGMGYLGIPVLSYSFMAVFDWMRTATTLSARGGALTTGYEHAVMRDAPLTSGGVITEDHMWENFEYFINRVVPVAEEAGVRLALHPDDPPISPVRGLGRIMCTLDALDRAIDLVPSPCNGLTFCQGTMTLMTGDLPAAIRHFGRREKIFYVHFRDVRGTPERFVETFQDDGQTDMSACVRAYQEIGFDGVMRPDHVPTLEGDTNERPGYSTLGRLFAIGYMTGLRETVFDTEAASAGLQAD